MCSWWFHRVPSLWFMASISQLLYLLFSQSQQRLFEWVRTQLGDDVWGKQRPVMSLYVRPVISSRCKCILVQVGLLIYSAECNFINLSLIFAINKMQKRVQGGMGRGDAWFHSEISVKFFLPSGKTEERERFFIRMWDWEAMRLV